MRGFVLQFLALFSVLCAGLHAPVAAHEGHSEARVILDATYPADVNENVRGDPSPDPSQEMYHHHHCPAAIVVECSHDADVHRLSSDMLHPGKTAVLASRALALPVEPPLA